MGPNGLPPIQYANTVPRVRVSKGLELLVDVDSNLLPKPVRVVEILVELLEHDTRISKLLNCHRTPQSRPTGTQLIAVSVQPC